MRLPKRPRRHAYLISQLSVPRLLPQWWSHCSQVRCHPVSQRVAAAQNRPAPPPCHIRKPFSLQASSFPFPALGKISKALPSPSTVWACKAHSIVHKPAQMSIALSTYFCCSLACSALPQMHSVRIEQECSAERLLLYGKNNNRAVHLTPATTICSVRHHRRPLKRTLLEFGFEERLTQQAMVPDPLPVNDFPGRRKS